MKTALSNLTTGMEIHVSEGADLNLNLPAPDILIHSYVTLPQLLDCVLMPQTLWSREKTSPLLKIWVLDHRDSEYNKILPSCTTKFLIGLL